MEINFEDYLNEDERKAIVAEVFRKQCQEKFKKDEERIFTNAAYRVVTAECDKLYDGEWQSRIALEVKRVVNELSAYTVFAKANSWERQNSKGYDLLQKAADDSAGLIKSRLEEVIGELSHDDLRAYIRDAVSSICDDRLFRADALLSAGEV